MLAIASGAAALASAAVLVSFTGAGLPFCGPTCVDRRLSAATRPDGALDPAEIATARALVRRQLSYSPVDDSAWLRLGAIEAAASGGRVSAAANRALETSYRFAPVHIQVAQWRLAFVFEHWNEVDAAVRNAALREMRSLGAAPQNVRALSELGGRIRNPSGRLAFLLFVDELARGP